jgi:hypothetical protein
MKRTIEFDQQCQSCNGTGLYVGLAERNGAAVICRTCRGTGCYRFKHEYDDFHGKQTSPNVKRVFEANPGIVIGQSRGLALEDFGGISVKDWQEGKPFPPKSENRKYTCPCWWYQSVNFKLKPEWDECFAALGSSFSACPCFDDKAKCWERWDKEFSHAAIDAAK